VNRYRAYWVARPRLDVTVSGSPSRFSLVHRPPKLSPWVDPPVRLLPLQSSTRSGPPCASQRRAPSLGFHSPSRHQSEESTTREASRPRFVPPSAFRTPSTAYSSSDLAGLFHPATTSGIHSSGSSPPVRLYELVARHPPRAVVKCRLPPVARQRQLHPARPQGFVPHRSPLRPAVV
jgi:hypothetical protein